MSRSVREDHSINRFYPLYVIYLAIEDFPGMHLRKEVIQPHLPVRLPCYDFAPITGFTLDAYEAALGTPGFHGVTGGVYKARERIHRGVLTPDY